MNTLTKGFAKRVLSALLVTIMVFSLGVVGLTSVSAANVELAETGWDTSDKIYVQYNDHWGDNVLADVYSNSEFGYDFTNVKTSGYLYFRFHNSTHSGSEWEWHGAATNEGYSGNEYLDGDISYATDYFYDNAQNQQVNWAVNMSEFASYGDTVNVYVKYYYSYYYNNATHYNVVKIHVAGGQTVSKDYYLPGSFNSWSTSADKFETDGSYLSTTLSLDADTYTFKVYDSSGTWYGASASLAPTPDASASATMSSSQSANANLTINTAYPGDYKFTLDTSTMKITVSFVKAAFTFSVSASLLSDSEIFAGTNIKILASSNGEAEGVVVTYTLKDADGNTVGESNTDGVFEIDTTNFATDTYKYTVDASCTIESVPYTGSSEEISVTVNKFEGLTITPVAPASVECGDNIDIVVTSNTDTEVTYVLKDGTGTVIATNTTGKFSPATTVEDKNTTKTFTVEATTTVADTDYTATPVTFTVDVVPISNTTEVTLYFKASSTYGYSPIATVTGVYETLTDVKMTKYAYICSNDTNTADYWWYKITTKVSDTNPNISFSVKSGRYAMEATAYVEVVDGTTEYYFGVDNLFYDSETNNIVDMTSWEPLQRNYCVSAVHMVYDDQYDTEDELNAFASKCVMALSGDVNDDYSVNVKDATYLQKSLVNLAELGTVGEKVSDVDDDGVSTIKDATAIQKAVAGL